MIKTIVRTGILIAERISHRVRGYRRKREGAKLFDASIWRNNEANLIFPKRAKKKYFFK